MKNTEKKKILLVEDDNSILQLLYYYLIRIKPAVEPVILYDLYTYAQVLNEQKFDLICTDINLNLPFSGHDILTEAKKSPLNKSTPVVAITAYSKYGEVKDYQLKGFLDLIIKPFDGKELNKRIEKILFEK